MNAWAISQVEHLSPIEIAGAVLAGLLALWLILALFGRRRPAPPPGQSSRAEPTDGALGPVIAAAEDAIRGLVHAHVPNAGVFHIGAVDLSPFNLAFWITTGSDAERDRLKADAALEAAFRRALAEAGYPAEAIPRVGFAFESQETCNRDYGGNWWHVVK